MDMKNHLETAWQLTISNIIPLVILTLIFAVVSIVSLGILAPVAMAGYFHAILLLVRDQREPKAQDIFSHLRLFLPLFLFGLIVVIISSIGFLLFVLPGIIFIVLISFFTMYMLPMMTDKNLGIIEASKQSFHAVTSGNTVDHIVVFLIFAGISAVGSSFFIGSLFLQPLATLFLMSVYEREINF